MPTASGSPAAPATGLRQPSSPAVRGTGALARAVLLLLLPALCWGSPLTAQEADGPESSLEPLLTAQSETLEEYRGKLERFERSLPDLVSRLNERLQTLSPYINQSIRLQSIFRERFREMLLLKRNVQGIESELQREMQPLSSMRAELRSIRTSLSRQREDFKKQFDYAPFVWNLEYNQKKLERITALINRAARLESRVKRAIQPAQEYLDKLEGFKEQLEREISVTWRDYYLKQSTPLFAPDLQQWREQLSNWATNLPIFLRYFFLGRVQWLSFGAHMGIFLALLFPALLLAGLKLDGPDRPVGPRRLAGTSAVLASALAVLLSYSLFHGVFQSLLCQILWQLLLCLGLVLILPPLRRGLSGAPPLRPNILAFLWAFFGLSLALKHVILPNYLLQGIWLLCLLAGLPAALKQRARSELGFERRIASLTPAVFGAGVLLCLAGWIQLSLLLIAFWFMACLGLYLGSLTTLLLKRRIAAIPDHGWGYVWQGVAQGMGVPLLWLIALGLIILWLGANLGDLQFLRQLSALRVGWGEISINLFRLFVVLVGMYLTSACLSVINSVLGSASEQKEQIDAGTANSLRALITYVVWSLYILFALAFIGFNLTSLTVVAGGLSVGIGFGLQSIVSNFISGLILLFGRSIRPGDIIQIGDLWAEVKEIAIRTTEIQTFDKSSILMPNSKLISEEIVNWTYRDKVLRRKVTLCVAYGSDTEMVKRLLLYIADTHPDVLNIPAPFVRFSDFGEGALEFTLYFFASMDVAWMTESELRFEIDTLFREYGIEIAIPQRGLHLNNPEAFPGPHTLPESGA